MDNCWRFWPSRSPLKGDPAGPFFSSLRGRSHTRGPSPGAGAVPLNRRPLMSALSLVAAQDQFTATLSAVEDAVRFAFRKRLRPQEYEEALAEAKAAAWSAWTRLIKRGKDPVAIGVHGIATNAIRYVRN